MRRIQKIFCLAVWSLSLAGIAFAGVNNATVQPLSPQAGRASVYQVQFTLTEPFPSAGSLTLEFPEAFDLSQAVLAGSPNVKGGFKVFVDGRRVRIQRSGLGPVVPAGTKIILRLANVRNPSTAGQFSVKMDVQAGKKILGSDSVAFSVLPKKRPAKPVK